MFRSCKQNRGPRTPHPLRHHRLGAKHMHALGTVPIFELFRRRTKRSQTQASQRKFGCLGTNKMHYTGYSSSRLFNVSHVSNSSSNDTRSQTFFTRPDLKPAPRCHPTLAETHVNRRKDAVGTSRARREPRSQKRLDEARCTRGLQSRQKTPPL